MAFNTPAEVTQLFANSAQQKDRMPFARLMVYTLLGGAFIALGGMLALQVAGGMPGVAASNPVKLMFGAVFPLGLFLVVIGGAELFTSDCAVMALSLQRREISWGRLLRLWSLVYLGNFVGALLVAWFMVQQTEIFSSEPWLSASISLGEAKTSAPFLKTFWKGVGANWLVCLAVWLAYAAKDVGSKMLAIWFPVMAFVAFGFEHSIANMFFIPNAMLLGADISLSDFLLGNLLPATLGNIAGGALLVGLIYGFMFPKQAAAPPPPPQAQPNGQARKPELTHTP